MAIISNKVKPVNIHNNSARMTWFSAFIVALISMPFSFAHALVLEDLNFNALPGGKVEIEFDFDGQAPDAKSYAIEKPARIALDFAGVQNGLARKKYSIDAGDVRSVVVLEAQGRTRAVVNLTDLGKYKIESSGDKLIVTMGQQSGEGVFVSGTADSVSSSEPKPAYEADNVSITDIDFQRGDVGEGKVMLRLSDSNVDVDVSKIGHAIRVTFFNTQLPERLRQKFDVIDFATPITNFVVDTKAKSTTIEIESTGDYDYLAYQMDDLYVVSVRPLTEEEAVAKNKEFKFSGERLSLNFQDIEVRSVLQLIADFTELNLVASDSVQGKVTLRLENVPWDQALDIVLMTKGLDKRQVGNVLMVGPADEIAARELKKIETAKQIDQLAALQTEFIRILYGKAADMHEMLMEGSISKRGTAIVDKRTNSLLITETADKLVEIRKVLKLVDVPVRQVQIEARIVVANSDFSRDLGIRWGASDVGTGDTITGSLEEAISISNEKSRFNQEFNTSVQDLLDGGQSLDNAISLAAAGTTPISVNYPDALAVDLGVTGDSATAIGVNFISGDFDISAELSALESSGRGEIVSQPKIITGDKQKATIKSGQQVPYAVASITGRNTISFKDAVLKLDVTPNITPDDRIILDLKINQDSLGGLITGEFNSQIPIIDTTELITQVLVENGQTVVLGGVFQVSDVTNVTKTPFLGDIPYLGRLFKRTGVIQEKTETLIFITPRIVAESFTE